MRFTTTELGELEAKIANAAERALALELEIFDRLAAARDGGQRTPSKRRRDALAEIDVAAALATLAVERDYVRPEVDGSLAFAISGGRHPVVEQALATRRRSVHRQRLRPVAASATSSPAAGEGRRGQPAASGSSPARTWPANRPSCARTR